MLLEKNKDSKILTKVTSEHAYVKTVFIGLVEEIYNVGRLKSKYHYWLKITNRDYWYLLNQLGGQCTWSEANSARCHFNAEKKCKLPVVKPHIEESLTALLDSIDSTEGWIIEHESETIKTAAWVLVYFHSFPLNQRGPHYF